jgi:choline kinase
MRAIIIGAGRGSRLMPTTENAPKCFAEIQGKRILDWTVEALRGGGCTEICFIGGYRIEAVRRDYPDFIFRENRDWQDNNILVSLMCAEDLMDRPFVAAYSDILFTRQLVADLMCSSEELVLGVDTDWREHYRPRTQHPPPDAEKVITRNGRVECVHRGIPTRRRPASSSAWQNSAARGRSASATSTVGARCSSGASRIARRRCSRKLTSSTCSRT